MTGPARRRIFVYGTLKRGGRNHRHLGGQTFLGEARTGPGVTLYSLGDFPGMVRDPYDTEGVAGELWEVDEKCLARLDHFEGVDEGLYERVRIGLLPPHEQETPDTYLYARDVTGRKPIGSTWPPVA
ncbi:MAG TPA: gamma-glutamylcyclotransferase family protein [Opitutaceae bacterium]|nr:gamma-glutamylcyclotransferase family protein [Opitutaceae bacterium]